MARYLHTMYRITDPERSRAFYEALGFESRRELPIVRDGELEATNYFLGIPGQEEELELTFNHDGRTYTWARRMGTSRLAVGDLDETLSGSRSRESSPSVSPTASARAHRGSASCGILIVSFER
jgi:lactoylglutathione lyase